MQTLTPEQEQDLDLARARARAAAEKPSPPSAGFGASAADIAAQTGSDLVEGAHSVPGFFGDADQLLKHFGWWLGNQARTYVGGKPPISMEEAGIDPQGGTISDLGRRAGVRLPDLPTTEDIEHATGFTPRQPRTSAGQKFENVVGPMVKMVPGVLTGGAPSLVKSAAEQGVKGAVKEGTRLTGKYAVAPVAVGQTAEMGMDQLPSGALPDSWREPLRRIVEVGTTLLSGFREKPRVKGTPTMDELNATKTALYKKAEDTGLKIPPEATNLLYQDALGSFKGQFVLDTVAHPSSFRMMQRLKKWQGVQTPITFNEYQSMRSTLGGLAAKAEAGSQDKLIASNILKAVDDTFGSLPPGKMIAGSASPAEVQQMLKDANRVASTEFKAKEIEAAVEHARNSQSWNSGNHDDALRAEFRKIANDPGSFNRFSPNEKRTILEIVRADSDTESVLKKLGQWSPDNNRFMATLIAGHLGGPAAGAATAVGTTAARRAVAGATQRGVTKLGAQVRKNDNKYIKSYPGVNEALRIGALYGARGPQADQQ